MVGRVNIILILIVLLSISATVDNSSATTISQSQEDWSPNTGEKLKCMQTITKTWTEIYGHETRNILTDLSVETYPPIDALVTWNDIPHLNETFSVGGYVKPSVFDLVIPGHDNWQGQGQHWFHHILPNRSSSFYENLITTLTQGPWNISITPEFFEDDTVADSEPNYWGYRYSFSADGYFYNVTATYWISAGYDASDNYAGVLRDGWVRMYDEEAGEIHMRRIRCSPSGPMIGGQNFYHLGEIVGHDTGEYTEGETGNTLEWTPIFWPKDFECFPDLFLNDTYIGPDGFTCRTDDSITYSCSVDGLNPGFYNFTFTVKDITRNTDTSVFLLTVLPSDTSSDTFENTIPLSGITMLLSGIGILSFICAGLVIYFNRKNRILD